MRIWAQIITSLCLLAGAHGQRIFFHGQQGIGINQAVKLENLYCGPGDVSRFAVSDGPAALPTQCIFTALQGTPSPGASHTVNTTCNDASTGLQATLNAISNNSGDIVIIPASNTCTGQYTVAYTGNASHWLTIRTDQIGNPNFPAQSNQATPCQTNLASVTSYPNYTCPSPAKLMPTLSASSVNGITLTITGSYVRVIGLEITKNYGTSSGQSLVNLQFSDHVILDRVQVHGDNWDLHSPNFDTHVGVATKGTYQAIINSWVYDVDWNSADGEGVAGGIGTQADEGPFKLFNSVIAGGSETWIWGGGFAAAWPHDFEFRRNLSMKPLKWMASFDGKQFPNFVNVKNLGEYKHGHRVLYEENVFINNWEGQSDQFGYALVVIPKNQARSNTLKFVNTNGTAITCASDALGTPCGAGTGEFGNWITSLSRTNNVVTVNGQTNGDWPNWNVGDHVVIQGIQSQVVSGTDLASFNGEWTMGCLPGGVTCTNGFASPNVFYFTATGSDFALTSIPANTGLAQDYTASTCPIPNHCHFSAPKANNAQMQIASVTDPEHMTTVDDFGVQTGVTQMSCHPGLEPDAQVQDFTIRYNYIAHSENIGINMQNTYEGCLDRSKGISKFSIHDNLADDIDVVSWIVQPATGHGGQGPIVVNAFNGVTTPPPFNITQDHNTWAGLRAYAQAFTSQGGTALGDAFNVSHNVTNVVRTSNVVTLTYNSISGDAPVFDTIVVSGFGAPNTDINGTWTVTTNRDTSVTFTESGSHSDIPSTPVTGVTAVISPPSYYANYTLTNNIWAGPPRAENSDSNLGSSLSAKYAANGCNPGCTWFYKNNVFATLPYAGYATPSGAYYASIPSTNPDASSTCTVTGGCQPTDLSTVFTSWGNGLGITSGNNYKVVGNYVNAGTDGRDLGADIAHINKVKAAVLPSFTHPALTISTASLTACNNGVYCEQQLLTSSNASGTSGTGYVKWHLTSGTLPTGMNLSTFDKSGATDAKVNGAFKTGPTGTAGWIWGTPTQTGSFPMTFQAEDAAHQTASVNLTLTVNP